MSTPRETTTLVRSRQIVGATGLLLAAAASIGAIPAAPGDEAAALDLTRTVAADEDPAPRDTTSDTERTRDGIPIAPASEADAPGERLLTLAEENMWITAAGAFGMVMVGIVLGVRRWGAMN